VLLELLTLESESGDGGAGLPLASGLALGLLLLDCSLGINLFDKPF
jgi:hypothetical protein